MRKEINWELMYEQACDSNILLRGQIKELQAENEDLRSDLKDESNLRRQISREHSMVVELNVELQNKLYERNCEIAKLKLKIKELKNESKSD